jgi:protein-arginine kinase activator protein McsA
MTTKPKTKMNRMRCEKCTNTFHKYLGEGRQTCSLNLTVFEVTYSNYSLLPVYNVQNKFIEVWTERAVFIFGVQGELIGKK